MRVGHIAFKSRIACGFLTVEQSDSCQYYCRRCADGCHESSLFRLLAQCFAEWLALIKVGSTRHTTRQKQQVGISQVALFETSISLDVHTVC